MAFFFLNAMRKSASNSGISPLLQAVPVGLNESHRKANSAALVGGALGGNNYSPTICTRTHVCALAYTIRLWFFIGLTN